MHLFKCTILATLLGAVPALGATINGDFSNGLTGYTAIASTNLSGDQDPTNFVGIANNSGNPYAELTTDPNLEALVLFITLQRTFRVTTATSLLSFDYGFAFDQANANLPSNFIPSFNDDRFSVQVRDLDAPGTIFDLGIYTLFDSTRFGTVLDPFGNSGAFNVSMQTASDPFFDTTVQADLSSLIGNEVQISFTVRDFFDGRQTGVGIDNFHLSAAQEVNVVPLPASFWMLLAALGAFKLHSRRRPV